MIINAKQWKKSRLPKRILAIRLQAMGDVIIALPYLQALKNSLPPDVVIDFLTRKEVASIPSSLALFNNVYIIAGKRNFKKQFLFTLLLLPKLFFRRYDIIIDLQNNKISRTVRKMLAPGAWTEFDRFSPISAGERNRLTIESLGINIDSFNAKIELKQQMPIDKLLYENGWDGKSNLIVLNPAGAFITRNWDIKHYVTFAELWLEKNKETQFLILGVDFILNKSSYLKQKLGAKLINLVGKTTPVEAFSIIQKTKFILTEDSGLMHIAWVSGVPTLAIFGSTRSDWSAPIGKHTLLLSSNDLPCGNCMLENCKYSDVHCITRYAPQFVFEQANNLLQSLKV